MSLVIGLEAKRGASGGLEENQQCLAIISGKAIIVSLGKAGLIFLDRDVMETSTGKEDSSEFMGLMFPASLRTSHVFPFPF